MFFFFFSSRRRHTRLQGDWSSDVCSSDLDFHKLLQRQKVLVKVDELLFHEEALKQLKRDVTALKVSEGPNARVDVGMFKERFAVTRKYAIPLLGYLDRERVTRRVGDARVVL